MVKEIERAQPHFLSEKNLQSNLLHPNYVFHLTTYSQQLHINITVTCDWMHFPLPISVNIRLPAQGLPIPVNNLQFLTCLFTIPKWQLFRSVEESGLTCRFGLLPVETKPWLG